MFKNKKNRIEWGFLISSFLIAFFILIAVLIAILILYNDGNWLNVNSNGDLLAIVISLFSMSSTLFLSFMLMRQAKKSDDRLYKQNEKELNLNLLEYRREMIDSNKTMLNKLVAIEYIIHLEIKQKEIPLVEKRVDCIKEQIMTFTAIELDYHLLNQYAPLLFDESESIIESSEIISSSILLKCRELRGLYKYIENLEERNGSFDKFNQYIFSISIEENAHYNNLIQEVNKGIIEIKEHISQHILDLNNATTLTKSK